MDNNKKLSEALLKADGIDPARITEAEREAFKKMLDSEQKHMDRLAWRTNAAMGIFALAMLGLCLYEKIFEASRVPFVIGCLVIMAAALFVMIRYMPGHNRKMKESGKRVQKLHYLIHGKHRGLILIGKKDGKRHIYWPRIITLTVGLCLVMSLGGAGVFYLLCGRWVYSSDPVLYIIYCTFPCLSLMTFVLYDGLKTPLDELVEVKQKPKQSKPAHRPDIWRIIMQSRITKFATAAVLVAAVLLSITFLDKTVTPVYAIEQTIEAYGSIRWLHAKEFYMVGEKKMYSELWIEFDDYGRLSKYRHHAPNCMGPQVGPLTIVNDGNETYAWLKNFNLCFRAPGPPEPDDASLLLQWEISEVDPKLVCERLYEQESRGEIFLEVNEPEHKNEPIVLVVTYPKGSLSENWKKMLYIDQATSLIKKAEKFEMRDGQYQHIRTVEFFDYNQPIDPDMFSLDGELPKVVFWIDQSGKVIGLAQGDMTDEEIAAEVTLQITQASIDNDYNRIGQLFLGVPGFLVEKASDGKVLEIISVGPAYPYSDPDSNIMICSCKYLAEVKGRRYEIDTKMWLRRVPGQAGRWMACGINTCATPVSDEEIETLDGYLDTDPGCVTYNGFEPGVFMQDWLVLGSIPVFDKELTVKEKFNDEQTQLQALDEDPFDIHQFEPTVIIDDKEYHWEFYHSPSELVDLAGPLGQQNFANAYALAQIEIEQDTPVLLAIGDDDRIKVWLNGKLVHKDIMGGHLVPDKAFIPVTLYKGINQLLLKVQNGITEWQFTCRIFEADYDPIEQK